VKLKLTNTLLAVLFLSLWISVPADAKTVRQRQVAQRKRISQGVQSGRINAKEAAKLGRGEKKIEKARGKAKKDGKLTTKEKTKLQHLENKEGHKIYEAKHIDR